MLRWMCLVREGSDSGGFEFLLQRYKKYIRYPKFSPIFLPKFRKKSCGFYDGVD